MIVDASVVVEFVAPDADDTETTHALFDYWAQVGESLHAPAMLPLEVMNALLTGVRRGRWDGEAADAAAGFAATLPISLHADPARCWIRAAKSEPRIDSNPTIVSGGARRGSP